MRPSWAPLRSCGPTLRWRPVWLFGPLLGCSPPSTTGEATFPTREPSAAPLRHVVVILADDVGWTDLSTDLASEGNGSDFYLTPRLDALAASATAFTQAWGAPVCSPGRAQLITGRFAAATGVYTNGEPDRGDGALRRLDPAPNLERLPAETVTLAERLRDAGFRTGHFGKWHLGVDGEGDGPLDQGFEVNVGGTDSALITGGFDHHFAQADVLFSNCRGCKRTGCRSSSPPTACSTRRSPGFFPIRFNRRSFT